MESLKTIITAISAAMFAASVAAQDMPESGIELNGLIIGHEYSMQQYYKALGGTPMMVKGPEELDAYPDAYTMYYMGDNRFERVNKVFHGFSICSPRYVLNGRVRVGDDLSVVESLGGFVTDNDFYEEEGYGVLEWQPNEDPIYVFFNYNKSNKIIKMVAVVCEL